MTIERLKEMTTQDKQVFAAKCLRSYCSHFDIADDSIDLLIEHLYAIKLSADLSRWERAGAKLELAGRGDPLPKSLLMKISKEKTVEFEQLLMDVVEVGLADMYAAESDKPFKYLLKCINVLQKYSIPLPR